ncbi:c-type cytochrome biogenesis protein CcmI [Palleronia pelagia]|uniref:Cytochrome c-type biogenesis protein CcmH n=1 Tax=Palleronia pelagia TaxID=387096 RepID=A0A1H8LYH7_9RHOB|nr:c-type cytochrome biogenesis protein CcmI [Palleronia pelagia]SEO10155.1 cytochrome c-type biogenesis protein CcmH [Palleronia pelagia]
MIWVFLILLAILAGAAVAFPSLRGPSNDVSREKSAMAILTDQLAEVSRDRERELISDTEAQSAEVEIKRRMLALSRSPDRGPMATGSGRAAVLAAAVAIPLFGAALYAVTGTPQVPSLTLADRAGERADAAEIAELAERLRERLESDPDGGPTEGWLLLAGVYSRLGQPDRAASAYARLLDRSDATSATFSLYSEALIEAEGGIVTPEAETAIDRAAALDPGNPAATYYKTVALEQAGARQEARDLLLSRLNAANGFQPWMESFVVRANYLGDQIGADRISLADYAPTMRGPSQDDIAAASELSEEDRGAFIRSMVDGLAARLEENPDDLDGWLRLGRAYDVLGELEESILAYESAQKLIENLSPDDPRRIVIREALGN